MVDNMESVAVGTEAVAPSVDCIFVGCKWVSDLLWVGKL